MVVKKLEHKSKIYYQCEECDMYYREEEIAQKCEKFCKENKACNMDLTKHAVNFGNKS